MRTTERHNLKSDRFAETAAETYSWAAAHRDKILWAVVAVAVIAAVAFGVVTYRRQQNEQANIALGNAMRTFNAPLGGAANPADPTAVSFTTAAERAKAARAQFEKVANDRGSTDAGKVARYMAGIAAKDMNDAAAAERDLKRAADSGDKDLASLAKMALAGLYRSTNRDAQAIDIYKDIANHPTNAVGKTAAQLELASVYESKQPADAARIYEEIRKESPNSAAAQIAATRLGNVK